MTFYVLLSKKLLVNKSFILADIVILQANLTSFLLVVCQEQEAAEAQALLEQKMEEAREREMESRRLQEELESARIQMEENQRALEEALNAPPQIITVTVPAVAAAAAVALHADHVDHADANVYEVCESEPPTASLFAQSQSIDDDQEDRNSEPDSSEQSMPLRNE